MGRSPCCVESGLKKGPWTQEEDDLLTAYIKKHGHGNWRILPKKAGLNRCGKSCRLRWINYLQPDIKRGKFSEEEEQMIIKLHSILGNKWSRIASHLPGRTDNEIKNYWNTHLRKKLLQMGIDPVTHRPRTDLTLLANLSQILSFPMSTPIMTNYPHDQINALTLQSNAAELVKLQVLHKIIQILQPTPNPSMDHSSALLPSQPNNNNNTKLPSPITPTKVFDAVAPSSSLSASVPATSDVEQCGGVFDSGGGSFSQGLIDANKYGNGALAENKLPGLVLASPTDQGLCVNENMPSNTNSIHEFMEYLPDLDFLDGWPNLIDDGTSESFWKDLLN